MAARSSTKELLVKFEAHMEELKGWKKDYLDAFGFEDMEGEFFLPKQMGGSEKELLEKFRVFFVGSPLGCWRSLMRRKRGMRCRERFGKGGFLDEKAFIDEIAG
jgi:hypothetical protein